MLPCRERRTGHGENINQQLLCLNHGEIQGRLLRKANTSRARSEQKKSTAGESCRSRRTAHSKDNRDELRRLSREGVGKPSVELGEAADEHAGWVRDGVTAPGLGAARSRPPRLSDRRPRGRIGIPKPLRLHLHLRGPRLPATPQPRLQSR